MVNLEIVADRLQLSVLNSHKLWSFRSHLEFPLAHIRGVRADPEPARGWWHGLRLLGTQLPGVLTAGTFYEHGGLVFYDVHDPEKTIVLELDHEHYRELVIEVADPAAAVQLIGRAANLPV